MVNVYFPNMGAECTFANGLWTVDNFVPDVDSVLLFLTSLTESEFPDGPPASSPNGDLHIAQWVAEKLGGDVRGYHDNDRAPPGTVY
jgi:hypothetical protein